MPMPNIDYVLYGYNVLYGNPLATGGTTDPGFASQIFKADYTGGLTSGDKRFLIPNGISVMSCDGNFVIKGFSYCLHFFFTFYREILWRGISL